MFFSGSELALKNLISYTHDYPLDLKIEPSVQPKNTFNNRRVVWVISVAPRKPRGGSTLSSFDRSSSQIAPSAANVGTRLKARRQRTDPFSIYTLHRHELVHRGFEPLVPRLRGSSAQLAGSPMRPMPPSRSSERRSFAPTSSTSDLPHRDLSGGSDRSAKIATRGLP